VTVGSGCPELCPQARDRARAREGGGCGSRGSTRRRSEGKASKRPERVRGSPGSLPGGEGASRVGDRRSAADGHPLSRPHWCRGGSSSRQPALGSLRGWGEGRRQDLRVRVSEGSCGRSPGPARRPLPLRQVFVQRPLCVWEGVGAGLLAWRFPSIVSGQ
jgi:hypothetical protein